MAQEGTDNPKNVLNEVIKRINEDRRRIKLLEQKIDRLESSISALEGASISQMGDIKITLDRINNKIDDVSLRFNKIEGDMNKIKKVISKGATKLELRQPESFIDLVNPITSRFVTKDELDRALDERIDKNLKKVGRKI
jgi:septal ring factor EnvC (AmiA/AmiB activator)